MASDSPLVGIIMGSQSDLDVMRNASEMLGELGISHEMNILSAHRNPEQVNEYAATARQRGLKVIIAGAGMAAALPGVVAAGPPLPGSQEPLFKRRAWTPDTGSFPSGSGSRTPGRPDR